MAGHSGVKWQTEADQFADADEASFAAVYTQAGARALAPPAGGLARSNPPTAPPMVPMTKQRPPVAPVIDLSQVDGAPAVSEGAQQKQRKRKEPSQTSVGAAGAASESPMGVAKAPQERAAKKSPPKVAQKSPQDAAQKSPPSRKPPKKSASKKASREAAAAQQKAAALPKPKAAALPKQPKNRSQEKQRADKRVSLVVPVSSVDTQVCRAARLVAMELEDGGWPEVSPGARQRAAASLQEFARTVFLPNMIVQGSSRTTKATNGRVFLATLLALREVLAQNAERIFMMENIPPEEGELDDAPGSKRRRARDDEEERQYVAQLFATGVVMAALQSLEEKEAEAYTCRLTEMIEAYDTGHDDFASCLEPLDGQHQGVQPNGKVLKGDENVAWKVSYNRAREAHPIVRQSQRRQQVKQQRQLGLPVADTDDEPNSVQVPTPTAVQVSMVEEPSHTCMPRPQI